MNGPCGCDYDGRRCPHCLHVIVAAPWTAIKCHDDDAREMSRWVACGGDPRVLEQRRETYRAHMAASDG